MQVLCKASNTQKDVTCKVCGQGFLVFWARASRSERERILSNLGDTLARHHAGNDSRHAHPQTGFTVPNWPAAASIPDAALFGGLQNWAS